MGVASEQLEILYRDRYLVAVNKPAGLLVHRSAVDRHENRFLVQCLRDQIGQRVYPVHRLDKPTAGVVVLGLEPEAAHRLNQAFGAGRVAKRYLAVVRGFTETQGRIDYPLAEQRDRMTDRRARRDKPPQAAVTDYRRIASVELPYPVGPYASARYSLLAAFPRTGRKHQIRRHMKHIFHPLIGDTTHGDGRHNRFFRERFDCRRLLLAAVALELPHPFSGEPLALRAAPDADFRRVLEALGWHSRVSDEPANRVARYPP
jgi:tRNA pseudouridine65 synthase